MHEVNVLDMLTFEPGAFYVMDRGYIDFRRLYKLHQSGSFFVTRAKSNLDARRVYSQAVDKDKGLIYNQTIMLNGFYKAQEYPEHLRRIKYRDPQTEQILIFLTNNTSLPALTIAALYKSRWQVEARGKVLSSWLSMFEHFSQHIVQCQRNSPLANLRRFCAALDRTCPILVCKRSACYRFGRDGIRIRRHYDRSLLIGLPLGTFSNDQSGGEDAYPVGSSRFLTHVHSYFRWKDSRSQHLGSLDHRAWSLLPDGSWVLGFRSPLCYSPISSFHCHSSQKQQEVQATIFSSSRQRKKQHNLRSNRCDAHFLFQQGLPQYIAKSNRQRRTRGKNPLLDKQFRAQASTDCRSLSAKVASRVVLQVDKTAFKNKEFFLGTTENAVKTQIWIAVCTYVLIAIMKKRLHLEQTMNEILQILSLNMFEKSPVNQIFTKTTNDSNVVSDQFQITLL